MPDACLTDAISAPEQSSGSRSLKPGSGLHQVIHVRQEKLRHIILALPTASLLLNIRSGNHKQMIRLGLGGSRGELVGVGIDIGLVFL